MKTAAADDPTPERSMRTERPSPRAERGLSETGKWVPDLDLVRMNDLTGAYREVAELIGLPAALALAEWRGGTTLPVPRNPGPGHRISRAIGWHWAQILGRRYAGERVSIPTLKTVISPQRKRGIRADHAAGVTVIDLVGQYEVSERHVRKVLTEMKK